MRIKIADATPRQIDWLVATIEDIGCFPPQHHDWKISQIDGSGLYAPTTNWSQGGPIIEREGIQLRIDVDGRHSGVQWLRHIGYGPRSNGPTPLIAAMRCYVASKLGEEVDVPEEPT